MTAKKVYGVAVGDKFRNDEGQEITVLRFITPSSMTAPWIAVVSGFDVEAQYEVHELKELEQL